MPNNKHTPTVYLATMDAFLEDAAQRLAAMDQACAAAGLRAMHAPSPVQPTPGEEPLDLARQACRTVIERVRASDAVVADMGPFRGAIEPCSSNVFAVGLAVALGKPVAIYVPDVGMDMMTRIVRTLGAREMPHGPVDARYGMLIEDFGGRLNLMIEQSAAVCGTLAQALQSVASSLEEIAQAQLAGSPPRNLIPLATASSASSKQVYLAGPDVFFVDPAASFAHLEGLCGEHGLQGLQPSDGGLSALPDDHGLPGHVLAARIYEANVERIRQSGAVVANAMPFRGAVEMDSGTAFEVGYATGLGKPLAFYMPDPEVTLLERISISPGLYRGPVPRDYHEGAVVENLGLPLNAVVAGAAPVFAQPDKALDHLARILAQPARKALCQLS